MSEKKRSGNHRIYNTKTQMWLKAFAYGGNGIRCYYFTKEYKEAKTYTQMRYAMQACSRMPEGCVIVDKDGNRISAKEAEA